MSGLKNPALKLFLENLGPEYVLAQVLIRPHADAFELRHVADRKAAPEMLRSVSGPELRALAQFTVRGAFRPLKAAPNLAAGWRTLAEDAAALEEALNHLYPGAVVDWFAMQQPNPPVCHYRDFTNRQTGMYRITQMLDDAQAGRMITAACHFDSCLKQRVWTVNGLNADESRQKSMIPCLEPCAVLMEFARKIARIEQEEKLSVQLAPGDLESVKEALKLALSQAEGGPRDGDMAAPGNPRRLRLLLDKFAGISTLATNKEQE
jgi:hypothetical protein